MYSRFDLDYPQSRVRGFTYVGTVGLEIETLGYIVWPNFNRRDIMAEIAANERLIDGMSA